MTKMSHPNEYGQVQYPFVYPYGYPSQGIGNVTQGTSSPIHNTAMNSYAVSLSLPGSTSTIEQGNDCFLKVRNPDKKSEYRVYTLKNLLPSVFGNQDEHRKEILSKVGTKMVSQRPDFTMGYFSGQTKVWIKDQSDLKHVRQLIKESSSTMLWCDGFQERLLKRVHQSGQDSDDDTISSTSGNDRSKSRKKMKSDSCEDKRERIETLKTKLQSKHGTVYTTIQYTLCAEMIDVGSHNSIGKPPAVPMF